MNARTGGPVPLTLPVGWHPAEALLPIEATGPVAVVAVRVTGPDGRPAWLYTTTGEVGASVRRRLRTEQPELDALLRRVSSQPGGSVLLPWLEYGDPKTRPPYVVSARPGPTFAEDLDRGPLPVAAVVAALGQCLDALHALHRHGRAHGLISPRSLHHEGVRVRLSAPLPPSLGEIVALAGGTGHEPPEVLRGGEQDSAADVFALASTAWTLLSGRPPFGAPDDQLARLTAASPPPLLRPEVPDAMESALRAALSPEPSRRPDLLTLTQALQIVEHGAAPVTAPPPPMPPGALPPDPGRQDTLAPTRPVSDDTGQPLGSRYLLDALIGRGATGHVWRGHTRDAGRPVAVKLLRSELAEDPEVVTRFMRERTALLGVHHPNLVAIRDLVAEGSVLAIVMDLVDGPDLRTVLDRGPLPGDAAARLLAQTAAALAAVHAADFVHRDLKPENVLVEGAGAAQQARLTDFGLARAVESSALTRTTQLVGTPAYIAPEIVAGRPPGPAVDVYALGITAYELLAGRRPFAPGSTAALLRAHLDEIPQRPDGMTDAAWAVVSACLRKDPADRPDASWLAGAWAAVGDGRFVAPWSAPVPAAVPPSGLAEHPPAAPSVPPLPSAAPDGEGAISETGIQATTAAQRPLAARHAPPAAGGRSRRRFYLILAAAVVVLGFGGGFGYAALHHPAPKNTQPATSRAYPLPASVDTSQAVPLVSWKLSRSLVNPDATIVLVYRVDDAGHRTPISDSLPGATQHSYAAATLKPGQCFIVLAYFTTKPAPKGLTPHRQCLPAAKTSSSATRSPTTVPRSSSR